MSNIDERRRKLLKLGTKLREFDEEVREWHQWFVQRTEAFEKSKMGIRTYETVLKKYEELLYRKRHLVPSPQVSTHLSKEEKLLSSPSSVICLSCSGENTNISQYCIFCGHELPKRPKPKITTIKSLSDPVPETVEGLKPKIKTADKSDDEKASKTITEEEIKLKDSSKEDIFKSHQKPVPKPPQKKEIIRKPVLEKDDSQIDVRKVPERKVIRKQQLELADIVSFGWLTILGSIIFVIVLIFITLMNPSQEERYPVGLLVFAFLLLLAGIIFDVLRWKNFDFSALGAIIAYIGIVMIFCIPMAYTFFIKLPEFLWLFWIAIAVLFTVGGAGARWSDYDTKIVDMATMAIAYWQNYEKRAAIRKVIELIGTFLIGLVKAMIGGIWHFPRRVRTFLGRIYQGLKLYIVANIGLITNAVRRILHTFWNNIHWVGLLAILAYLGLTGLSSYQNIELLIIMSFFFFLGLVTSRSERVVGAINNARTIILKGAISAYSMLTGAKIKKEESVFCSRCLRGVHRIEFAELQHADETENPLCPFCGFENWVTVS